MSTAMPVYEVVSPLGKPSAEVVTEKIAPAPPVPDWHRKKIGLIWIRFPNGDVLLESFGDLLAKRFNDLELIKLPPGKGLHWGDNPHESIGDLAEEAGLDAAIVAAGC